VIVAEEVAPEQTPGERQPGTRTQPGARRSVAFRPWFWALVPLLATAAYATATRVGFLVDDLQFLTDASRYGFDLGRLIDEDARIPYGQFYRPVGIILTWRLDWFLWGANPFPYHVQGVLIHATAALLVGLWVAEASQRRSLGWLAGALFGVWPLHTEAVAWVSAQWDALAVLFGMASLLLLTRWWRSRTPRPFLYLGAVALYAVALLTKESMLTFIGMFALAAWYVAPSLDKPAVCRLILSLGPLLLVFLGVVAHRFLLWGNIGGYDWVRTDFTVVLWDRFIEATRLLVVPVNPAVVGAAVTQITGLVASVLLLGWLIAYAHRERRLLAVAGLWTIFALVPGVHLRVSLLDMHNNRYLYLAAVGTCTGIATLIYTAVTSLSSVHLRRVATGLVGALLVSCCALTWLHLEPWHAVTVMVDELDRRMLRLMPPRQGGGLDWYVENRPNIYKGAFGPSLALGYSRGASNGDIPRLIEVPSAAEAIPDVAGAGVDAFAMRFASVTSEPHIELEFLAGITNETEPPTASNSGGNLTVWDFTGCDEAVLSAWSTINARTGCVLGTGMKLQPQTDDPQLLSPEVAVSPGGATGRAVRLRAAIGYPPGDSNPAIQQWFWAEEVGAFREDRSRNMLARQDGNVHVYWTFLQGADIEGGIKQLRFDPRQNSGEVEIRWLALDVVP
jgi:hypothetical protein